MGLLPAHRQITGIMITPACDVSNFKAETFTYLPVIPVSAYLATVALLPTVRREVIARYGSAKIDMPINWPDKGYEPPTDEALVAELARLQSLSLGNLSPNDKAHIERAAAGLRIARVCRSSSEPKATVSDYEALFGKQWEVIRKDLVTNAYRPDIHFLPADGQKADGFTLVEHSVALFRYPISAPSEILTAAQTVHASGWQKFMHSYRSIHTAAVHFEEAKPIKVLSLKASFLPDLLSRFTALYSRIGSPDFSRETVDRYVGEIA